MGSVKGDYDAIIMGHSQFERIPLSLERRQQYVRWQLIELDDALSEIDNTHGKGHNSIRQIERAKKSLQARLDKLESMVDRDDVLTFEELGVDHIFVDEAHEYKNLLTPTKLSGIAGISNSSAAKASDLKAKCEYLDELTGNRGVTLATATPVMNSLTEMYVFQKYLQEDTLEYYGWNHLDAWIAQFAEVTSEMEIAPEGGYRERKRLSRFANLPELKRVFLEVADVKTDKDIHLPKPELEVVNVVAQPSEVQKAMIADLSHRADVIHQGGVDPSEDNMLKLTSDGRKIGLDQRLMDSSVGDFADSKVNLCVDNVLKHYREGMDEKLTQIVFCDTSTPSANKDFNIYDDVKAKLIEKGIPAEEIAFIHDATTQRKKDELHRKVRSGDVRVILGSTKKLGTGTNVQDRIIALHDLDCPWRPGDLTQRLGRGWRQGNQNKEITVYRYSTEGTFDAYLWQGVEKKQMFIEQVMSPDCDIREFEDPNIESLQYAQTKALCSGDPRIKRKIDLEKEIRAMTVKRTRFLADHAQMQDDINTNIPERISGLRRDMQANLKDSITAAGHPLSSGESAEFVGMTLGELNYTDKAKAGLSLLGYYDGTLKGEAHGTYRGFEIEVSFQQFRFIGERAHLVDLDGLTSANGVFGRIDGKMNNLTEENKELSKLIQEKEMELEQLKVSVNAPFAQEDELIAAELELAKIEMDFAVESAKENEIDAFVIEMYGLISQALPQALPQNQPEYLLKNNLKQHICAGNTANVCAPLEEIAKHGNYENRERAQTFLEAYQKKAEVWAVNRPSKSKEQSREVVQTQKNRDVPEAAL